MNFVALRMLMGDRAKFLGLVFAVAFSSFLIAHQSSIFSGLMLRTTSQIRDVIDADIWVMDSETQYIDEVKPLSDEDLYRVRSVQGVAWAVKLFKGLPRAKAEDGKFRTVILMGVDDSTLVGAPRKMIMGSIEDLRRPDSVIIDRAGFFFYYPKEPL
ncbi:MAG: ABC transporter permease, partial [Blastocatellia bacterium]|nr:ABC transporter permease [Blastocatellia bacterium]